MPFSGLYLSKSFVIKQMLIISLRPKHYQWVLASSFVYPALVPTMNLGPSKSFEFKVFSLFLPFPYNNINFRAKIALLDTESDLIGS